MDTAKLEETVAPSINGDKKTNRIRYSLVRKEEEVELEDDHNNVTVYKIKEMVGAVRDRWMNSNATRMETKKDGTTIMRVFDNVQASLICLCLYDARGNLVTEETIARWPASLQQALFDRCQDMNGLTDRSRDEAKKV